MLLSLILATTLYALFLLTVVRRIGIFNPSALFVSATYLMCIGTLLNIDPASKVDVDYAKIMTYSSCVVSILSMLLLAKYQKSPEDKVRVVNSWPNGLHWVIMVGSALIVVAYFQAVGYSAFLEGLRGLQSGSEVDVATLRLESYSGTAYFAPGYVAQFKNAILPALVLVAWASGVHRRSGLVLLALLGLTTVSLFGLIGTGQRQALVVAMLVVLCFLHQYRIGRNFSLAKILWAGAGAVVLLLLMTSVLGRSEELQYASSWFGRLQAAWDDLIARVLSVNQISGIYGYRYTSGLTLDYPGQEWVQAFAGLAPGNTGSTLASEIFASRYGSDRGTSPESLWGSVNYNFGWTGTILIPFFITFLVAQLTRVATSPTTKSMIEAVGLAGMSAVIGFWVAGSPITLLNTGLPGFVFLWWWGRRRRRSDLLAASTGKTASATAGRA